MIAASRYRLLGRFSSLGVSGIFDEMILSTRNWLFYSATSPQTWKDRTMQIEFYSCSFGRVTHVGLVATVFLMRNPFGILPVGKQSRGDNKKISEYFKGHHPPPSSPGRQSGTKSPLPVQQQQQPQQQAQQPLNTPPQQSSFMGVPSASPSPHGANAGVMTATTTTTTPVAPGPTSYSASNNNHHSSPAGND